MMISIHAYMRDYYQKLTLSTNILLFTCAVVLNSLVFTNTDSLHQFGINLSPGENTIIVALASLFVFLLSIIMLLVKWDKKAANHDYAVKHLSQLLIEVRKLIDSPSNVNNNSVSSFMEKYSSMNSILIPIPEKKFNRLKHKHYQKVALSKYISDNHIAPYWYIKLQFWLDNLKKGPK